MSLGERFTGSAFLSNLPAGPSETRIASLLVMLLGAAFLVAAPFATKPVGPVAAFMPGYEAALILCDLITAVLLIGQFAHARSAALLILGGGYLFDALMIVAHALSFPGLFSATGLLGAGEQTTIWLYILWHAGFPIFVLGYLVLRARESVSAAPKLATGRAVATVVAGVTVLATGCAVLAFPGHALLPELIHGTDHLRLLTSGISPTVWLLSIAAFAALWRVRRRSILDLWLAVVMWAWVMDVGLAIVIGSARFDLGFYVSRSFGLLAASIVLAALLLEMIRLYGRLTQALDLAEARNIELARSREGLARAQRMEAIGQLTGGVAHDFNNLLTVVSGNLELMRESPDNPTLVRHLAERALLAADRGARITEQLLTFARRQISHPITVDLSRLLDEFVGLLRQAVDADVELELRRAAETTPARLDPSQFEAAVLNLVVNARDAMPRGGRIVLETRSQILAEGAVEGLEAGAYVVVAVSDSGIGMSPEVSSRAFEPFFTTKDVGKGSGLGLSQVYGFVTSVGGQVAIETSPGEGTRVALYFPRSAEPAQAAPEPAAAQAADSGTGTVLVVEDDAEVLGVTVTRVSLLGYRALPARDAAAALELLSTEPVDLLFTDVVLGGAMNGMQLGAEARRIRSNLPVLLTSGYSEATLRPGDGTAADLLRKPYSQDELARRLHHAMRSPASLGPAPR